MRGQKLLFRTTDIVGPRLWARPQGDAPFSVLALGRDQVSIMARVTKQWAHLFKTPSLSPGCGLRRAGTRAYFSVAGISEITVGEALEQIAGPQSLAWLPQNHLGT